MSKIIMQIGSIVLLVGFTFYMIGIGLLNSGFRYLADFSIWIFIIGIILVIGGYTYYIIIKYQKKFKSKREIIS